MITKENLGDVLQDIENKVFDIPFGQSVYQIEKFILSEPATQGRLTRQLGLEMQGKVEAIRSTITAAKKREIDIEYMQARLNINSEYYESNQFERRKIELDIQEKQNNSYMTEKLLKDAFVELNYMYTIFNKLPKMSRQDFEMQEQEYYADHLLKQVTGLTGAHESLYQMGKYFNEGVLKDLPKEHLPYLAKSGLGEIKKLEDLK